MARLEIGPYDGPVAAFSGRLQVKCVLSRRNLAALTHKLDMPGSARRIEQTHVIVDGEITDELILVCSCEDDDAHYLHPGRGNSWGRAGRMHPDTEAFIARIRPPEKTDEV